MMFRFVRLFPPPPDIVDFLHENILPQLEQKLETYRDADETLQKENEEKYLLSDIFRDISEDDDEEEECDEETQ